MKLRTSYFNGAVLKKDITRFAPVWGLYTAFLFVLFIFSGMFDAYSREANMNDLMMGMGVLNLVYAAVCAAMVFGDLFQSRMCNALHAMPLRREGWFFSHVAAALLMCVVPNAVASVILMVILQQHYYLALLWLALMVLQFLFFFGLAAVSAMCAGNRLGMAAVYVILNFFSIFLFVLTKKLYEPLLYGIQVGSDLFNFFSPVVYMCSQDYVICRYDYITDSVQLERIVTEVWPYLLGVAAIGIGALVLAVWLYRRRKLEYAGDFMAIKSLAPVFLIIYTLGCGLLLYAASDVFGYATSYMLLVIGIVVGFFTGNMLLERTVRVFRRSSFLRFALFALALVASLALTKLDPAGITRYVPETEDVAFMRVYWGSDYHVYSKEDEDVYQLESQEEIADFQTVHRQLTKEQWEKTDGACDVEVMYKMKNGQVVRRYYEMDENSAVYDTMKSYFSDFRYLCYGAEFEELVKNIQYIEPSMVAEYYGPLTMFQITKREDVRAFMEAVLLDCRAGNMAQPVLYHPNEDCIGWIHIQIAKDGIGNSRHMGLTIYPSNTHIKALLDRMVENYGK